MSADPGPARSGPRAPTEAEGVLSHLRGRRDEIVQFARELVLAESPSTVPESQAPVRALLHRGLEEAGLDVRHLPGRETGGHLYARPPEDVDGPSQLLLGHMDTVWPLGTLRDMPAEVDGDVLRGPGIFDMKGGLAIGIFALRALRDLGLAPPVAPIFLITSDEEIGSPESERHIVRLAKRVDRSFVLEPALGLSGKIKTRRKGVGHFTIRVVGKSAHGGLAPEQGASAILELSHVIQSLHALADPERGITVNVGVIEGGLRTNVVAPSARAEVDVRVWNREDARRVEEAIHGLAPAVPGTRLEVSGCVGRDPLEKTRRNERLWKAARALGSELGLALEEGHSGGASDGNFTSAHTATLDGLGAVGDGAHAEHEFVYIDSLVERAALVAGLLALPPLAESAEGRRGA